MFIWTNSLIVKKAHIYIRTNYKHLYYIQNNIMLLYTRLYCYHLWIHYTWTCVFKQKLRIICKPDGFRHLKWQNRIIIRHSFQTQVLAQNFSIKSGVRACYLVSRWTKLQKKIKMSYNSLIHNRRKRNGVPVLKSEHDLCKLIINPCS